MAIIVEDGSRVTGANSYVTEAELTTYASDRGITLTGTASELIYLSMDYVESLDFIGYKYTEAQPLQWPRYGVIIDRYYVDVDEIPKEVKNLQLSVAVAIDQGADPLQIVDRAVKRERIDDLEIEYQNSASTTSISRLVLANLRKLVAGSRGGNNFVVGY